MKTPTANLSNTPERALRSLLRGLNSLYRLQYDYAKLRHEIPQLPRLPGLDDISKAEVTYRMRMLRKRVLVRSVSNPLLTCLKCLADWSPNILPGGKFHKNHWHCPNACNVPNSKPSTRRK